jgi:hypothetical protein
MYPHQICCKAAVSLGVLILFATMAESYTISTTNPNGRLGKLVGGKTQCSGICLGGNSSKKLWKLNCERWSLVVNLKTVL